MIQQFADENVQSVKLNELFASMIRSSSQFALVTPPSYAMCVFRLEPPAAEPMSEDALNDINRLFYGRISARSDILLTQTQLNGTFCIRFAVGAARTTEEHIQKAYDLLCVEGEQATITWKQTEGALPS